MTATTGTAGTASTASTASTAGLLDMYAKLSSGVSVLTTQGADGPVGATTSTVVSLSARPPLLLVSLAHASRTLTAIRAHGSFAVHVLHEWQRPWAERCADPATRGAERFAGQEVHTNHGVPVCPEALAWAVCTVHEIRPYGDHHAVVGRVTAVHAGEGSPLLWHDRAFGGLGQLLAARDVEGQ